MRWGLWLWFRGVSRVIISFLRFSHFDISISSGLSDGARKGSSRVDGRSFWFAKLFSSSHASYLVVWPVSNCNSHGYLDTFNATTRQPCQGWKEWREEYILLLLLCILLLALFSACHGTSGCSWSVAFMLRRTHASNSSDWLGAGESNRKTKFKLAGKKKRVGHVWKILISREWVSAHDYVHY